MSVRSGRAVEQASRGLSRLGRVGSFELDRLLTKAEAATVLSVSIRFVERCVLERRIRYVKLGKFVRIPMSAIVEFIDDGEVPARK